MKAFCLCLDKRQEHWLDLEKQVNNSGIEFERFIVGDGSTLPIEDYDYIDDPNPDVSRWGYGKPQYKKNHYNAFMAHQEIILRAKKQGLKQFLMLEDDTYLTYRFDDVFQIACPEKRDLDLLYLGWWIGDENDEWNTIVEKDYYDYGVVSMQKAKQIGGLHGVVIYESMYDTILSLKPINPIDCQLNKMHDVLKSYFVTPKATHVKSTWSFCEGQHVRRNTI